MLSKHLSLIGIWNLKYQCGWTWNWTWNTQRQNSMTTSFSGQAFITNVDEMANHYARPLRVAYEGVLMATRWSQWICSIDPGPLPCDVMTASSAPLPIQSAAAPSHAAHVLFCLTPTKSSTHSRFVCLFGWTATLISPLTIWERIRVVCSNRAARRRLTRIHSRRHWKWS